MEQEDLVNQAFIDLEKNQPVYTTILIHHNFFAR